MNECNPTQPPRHRPGDEFLKGPVPLAWLHRAAKLPGKALAVGVAVWFKAGATRSREVRLSGQLLSRFGLNRHSAQRGLAALEAERLVSVERHPGRCSVVTLKDAAL